MFEFLRKLVKRKTNLQNSNSEDYEKIYIDQIRLKLRQESLGNINYDEVRRFLLKSRKPRIT